LLENGGMLSVQEPHCLLPSQRDNSCLLTPFEIFARSELPRTFNTAVIFRDQCFVTVRGLLEPLLPQWRSGKQAKASTLPKTEQGKNPITTREFLTKLPKL